MNGLSNAGFMGGLIQGAQAVEGMQNRSKANDRADAQASRAQESHDQNTKINNLKINEAEQKVLFSDLDRDLRAMEETGKTFTKEQWKKYKPVGFDKFNNEKWREENKDAGAMLHRGMTTGQWNEGALDAFNTTFYDELRDRDRADGLKRKIIGIKETEDGRSVAILQITGKDGKKYNAPLTKGGTADDEDTLVLFDDDKLEEIYKTQMHRADMAYAVDKAGGDPKKLAQALRRIAFKQSTNKAPEIKSIFDDETGREQKMVWNGSQYVPIGGTKTDFKKGSSDPRLGGSGGSESSKAFIKAVEKYQADYAKALELGDPEVLKEVQLLHQKTTGLDFDLVEKAAIYKRSKINDYSPLTYEEFSQFNQQMNNASANADVNELVSNDAELFGNQNPQQESAPDGLAIPQAPQSPQAPNNAQGLSNAAGFRGMPNITPEQRQGIDAINQTKAQVKTQLMGELESIRSAISSSGRRTPTKREADLLKAIREIDSAYDMGSLNAAIAKMKLGEESQKPGIKDAAHMAAL